MFLWGCKLSPSWAANWPLGDLQRSRHSTIALSNSRLPIFAVYLRRVWKVWICMSAWASWRGSWEAVLLCSGSVVTQHVLCKAKFGQSLVGGIVYLTMKQLLAQRDFSYIMRYIADLHRAVMHIVCRSTCKCGALQLVGFHESLSKEKENCWENLLQS